MYSMPSTIKNWQKRKRECRFKFDPELLYWTLFGHCLRNNELSGPASRGSRIHRLHLCRGVRSSLNECPVYDTKKSDGVAPVMLELWGIKSSPSLPFLPGSLWPREAVPDRVLFVGLIELNCEVMLSWIVWN